VTTALAEAPTDSAAACALLTDPEEIAARFAAITSEKLPFAFDIETGYHGESRESAALHPEENFVVSLQLTNSLSWARDIPLGHDNGPNVDNAMVAALAWQLLHAVDDAGLPMGVAHGAVFELRVMARWFLRHLWNHPLFGRQVIEARGYFPVRSCTMLESFAEGENPFHGLKDITLLNFGYQMRELSDLLAVYLGHEPTRPEKKRVRFNVFDCNDPEVIAYACEDVIYTLKHHLMRWPRVCKTFIYKVEMSVLPIVCEMADEGLRCDWNLMRDGARRAREFAQLYLGEIMDDFAEIIGEPLPPTFNFGSPDQLRVLFYDKCGLTPTYFTSGGKSGNKKPSVDAKHALPELAKQNPAIAKYQEWKRLTTLCESFLEIYEAKYSWASDGRAHCSLLQHGTTTGRFSCENFNYQQAPKKYRYKLKDGTRFDFNFRDCIAVPAAGELAWWELVLLDSGWERPEPDEPDPGWYLLGGDYSQIELRVMAAEAGETALLEAFLRGDDVHRLTAALMLGIPLDQVTPDQRGDTGKRMNFAIGYQMSPKGLADQMGQAIEVAEELFAQWHAAYPRIKKYTQAVVRRAHRDGFIVTKFGRKVPLPNINGPRNLRSADERTAGNAVTQGPATGEYVKVAMVRARKALAKAGLADKVRMVMNIHDALEFYVRKDVPPARVIEVLTPAVIYPVKGPGAEWPPLVMDWHMGLTWGSVKDLEVLDDGSVRLKGKDSPPPPVPAAPLPVPAVGAGARAGSDSAVRSSIPPPALAPSAGVAASAGPGRKVLIVVQEVPDKEKAGRLVEFLGSLPGANTVELHMPNGAAPFGRTCGAGPEHEAHISIILGGASVHYALDSVDTAAMSQGLDL
jgi:DNA polymerase I-like protein with 3'-5' exonuclease and polymerase domains